MHIYVINNRYTLFLNVNIIFDISRLGISCGSVGMGLKATVRNSSTCIQITTSFHWEQMEVQLKQCSVSWNTAVEVLWREWLMDQQELSLLLSVPSTDLMLRSSIIMRLYTSKKVNYHYLKNHEINSNFMFVLCLRQSWQIIN